jgi:predicted amidohydrolase
MKIHLFSAKKLVLFVFAFDVLILIHNTFGGDIIKVAAISFEPEKLAINKNADKLKKLFREAAKSDAKIAVAPEGAIDGYIVNEIIKGEIPAEKMKEVAISIDHLIIREFQQLAAESKLCLVFGFAEKVGDDIYNTAIFIDNTGKISGKYHKMQLAEGAHPDWWFNRLGHEARAFDTPFGRVGLMICNDRWNPLLAQIMKYDGAQMLIIPSFGSVSKAQDAAVLARSKENQIPLIEANVGVTLIADGKKIVAVNREKQAMTIAEIEIPPAGVVQVSNRNQAEMQFLKERIREMPMRYQNTMKRLKSQAHGF